MPTPEAHEAKDLVEQLWPFAVGLGAAGKILIALTKRVAESTPATPPAPPKEDEPGPPSWDYVRILEADRKEDRAEIAQLRDKVQVLYNALDSGTRKGTLDPPEKP